LLLGIILERITVKNFNYSLEEKKMKKVFSMFLAVAFALSMVGVAFAADNAAKSAAPAAAPAAEKKAAPAPAAEKKASKPKSQQVTGTIEALDAAAGTFTVKGKKGNVDLKAGEKVKLDSFKIGDKVYVKYVDGTASSVKGVKATGRAAKKATKKAVKKAAEKVEDAVKPAPAPAEKK